MFCTQASLYLLQLKVGKLQYLLIEGTRRMQIGKKGSRKWKIRKHINSGEGALAV